MEKIQEYLLNKIFTVPYIDKMIYEDIVPDSFLKCVHCYERYDMRTIGNAISEIYRYMDRQYRNEYFYKNTIFNQLLLERHNIYNTAALSELPIAESKADFVMINGRGVVYEIKTDLDNLSRLENQINDYYQVFSYVYIVASNKHLEKIKEIFKNTKVGIYELTDAGKIIRRKVALCNRDKLLHEVMFRLLRKHEFEEILSKHYKMLPDVNNFLYYRQCLDWAKKINILTFQKDVMHCLKRRTLVAVNDMLSDSIPYELKFYSYFSKKYRFNSDVIDGFLSKEMEV